MATADNSLTVPVLLAVSTLPTLDEFGLTEVNLHTLKGLLEDFSDVIDIYDQQSSICSTLQAFFSSQTHATYANFVDYVLENVTSLKSFLLSYNSCIRRSYDPEVIFVNESFFRTLLDRSHEFEMIALIAEERSDRYMNDRNKLSRVVKLMEKKVTRRVFFEKMKLLDIDLTTMIDLSKGDQECSSKSRDPEDLPDNTGQSLVA